MRYLQPMTDLMRALNDRVFGEPRGRSERDRSQGQAHVGPNETLGGEDCWCGRPNGHDWPGRKEGAPHPRYPD